MTDIWWVIVAMTGGLALVALWRATEMHLGSRVLFAAGFALTGPLFALIGTLLVGVALSAMGALLKRLGDLFSGLSGLIASLQPWPIPIWATFLVWFVGVVLVIVAMSLRE